MLGLADYLLIVIAVVLITLVVVQSSKDDIQSAFSGEKSELFANQKERGVELFMSRATLIASFLFIAVSIWAMIS
ncbi:MAG: preprotein translocase subunit SecG [Candidatus Izemoplasmataceae bacterium]|jgi:preprotein translocase subunit SecG|uniref:preprotein translocase subunit SecG n=1 Tax=Liberiplasma polymorphum TaxID=3374570 RepID=UPI003771F248